MRIRLFIVAMCLSAIGTFAQATNYKVYAAFIFSIAKYSQWPPTDGEVFNIVVVGKSKLYDELLANSARHAVAGRKIQVVQIENALEVTQAQLIVVADTKSNQLDELAKATNAKPIMIITEREGLHKKGAAISFFIAEDGKLKFDLNMTELSKRSVDVSKSIRELAATVL